MSKFIKDVIAQVKKQIEPLVEDAWAETVSVMNEGYDEVISDESGKYFPDFVGQDIIDTSRFLNSKVITAVKWTVEWLWNPIDPQTGYAYARALLNGFWAFGKKWIPARDWIKATFVKVDPVTHLANGLSDRGFSVKIVSNSI